MEFLSLKGGLIMSVIAFSIVFIVIFALMLIMMSASKIARSLMSKHTTNKLNDLTSAPLQDITPATLPESSTDDNELIAAIIGAVVASNENEVRICSIQEEKRTMARPPLNSIWKISARTINHENCF